MEEKKARLFVNAPNALAGNEISKCDTSSAAFQSEEAGIVDFVGDEAAVLGQIRDCLLYTSVLRWPAEMMRQWPWRSSLRAVKKNLSPG